MRTFEDEKIKQLRRKGELTGKDGKRYRPVKKELPAKVSLTSEERQARALEAIVAEVKGLLQANSQNAVVLLEMIKKLRTDVRLDIPIPARKWEHTVFRNGSGKTERIITEVI